jgi:hypothetical protein
MGAGRSGTNKSRVPISQQRIDRRIVTSRHISSHLVTLSPFLFGLLSSLVFGGGTPQRRQRKIEPNPQTAVSLWHCNDMYFEIKRVKIGKKWNLTCDSCESRDNSLAKSPSA